MKAELVGEGGYKALNQKPLERNYSRTRRKLYKVGGIKVLAYSNQSAIASVMDFLDKTK